ncbi:MAG: hypothetical protein LBB72_00905 [Spirochaetaceae bacterium]|jgi:hypothetical protein|nr:hypothetical protein [Spirochaetaceae bacterium]
MKNVLKTVAMVLIVVMVANSLTGCIILGQGYDFYGPFARFALGFDLILIGAIVLGVIGAVIRYAEAEPADPTSGLAKGGAASDNQTYVLSDQIGQSSYMENFNALPETQIDTLAQKVQAVPEAEKISFMETYNALPQTNAVSIMDELNALSETELNNTVEYLNSLSEVQFLTLFKNIQDNAAFAAIQ